MTTRTVVDLIVAAAARLWRLGTPRLDDTRDPGAVQAPARRHVAVVPAPPTSLSPSPDEAAASRVPVRATVTSLGPDRSASTAPVAARRGSRSGPTTPEAGVHTCLCDQPVLRVCVSEHGRWNRHTPQPCPDPDVVTLDAAPTRYGRWELVEPCRWGARAVPVDPAVAVRPTYQAHQCRQGVAA